MNHTRGPWEVHQVAGDRNSVQVCVPDSSVERGCRTVAEAEILGVPRLEAEANARLIAAAPELLEACKRIVSEDQNGEITIGAIKDCMSAIKKAEGE